MKDSIKPILTLVMGIALLAAVAAITGLLPGFGALRVPTAQAAGTIMVTTTEDQFVADDLCSLREAVESINTGTSFGGCENPDNTADTIQLEDGTYILSIPNALPFDNSLGNLRIGATMTIRGRGAAQTIISATEALDDNVMVTFTPVTIEGVTIQGGRSAVGGGIEIVSPEEEPDPTISLTDVVIRNNETNSSGGGGIAIQGDGNVIISLVNVIIENNRTLDDFSGGGGIECDAESNVLVLLSLEDVIIRNNETLGETSPGGGIFGVGCNIILNNVTISGNKSSHSGGGIFVSEYFETDATLQMSNVTVYGNEAQLSGGGLNVSYFETSGTIGATAVNATIAHNHVISGSGGNLYNDNASLALQNTIVAHGTAADSDNNCDGNPLPNITSLGHNLDSDGSCVLNGGNDIENADPLLADTLADNGGFTPTLALLAGSPAIDNGTCSLDTDQRGLPRPGRGTPECDIGAFEFQMEQLYLPSVTTRN